MNHTCEIGSGKCKKRRNQLEQEEHTHNGGTPDIEKMFVWLQTLSTTSCKESCEEEGEITFFDSADVPDASLSEIFDSLCKGLKHFVSFQTNVSSLYEDENVEESLLVCTLIYINRLVTLTSVDYFNEIRAHRILITAFLLVIKYTMDIAPTNKMYAEFCGLRKDEVNRLEETLVKLLDYRLLVSVKQFGRMCNHINSTC